MSANSMQADRVFLVCLRSYGFFHSGRERLVTQVLKRTWDFIPGSTLYGAIAAALIRLDPESEELDHINPATGTGDYARLLRAVEQGEIRFTPLLPAPVPLKSGRDYCRQAMRLVGKGRLESEEDLPAGRLARKLLHTTPHAPLARATEQIHSDQLFAMRTHQPQIDYYGFIFGRDTHLGWLEKGLRLLPFLPVGGQGKFSLIEGEIEDLDGRTEFGEKLRVWIGQHWAEKAREKANENNEPEGGTGWVRLLTPLVMPKTDIPEPLNGRLIEEVVMTRFQRYRVWRTGRYFNGEGFDDPLGIGPYYGDDDAPLQAGGAESVAVQAVPENSRFCLQQEQADRAARWFVEGIGHPGWSYLGWGQVVIE